MFIAIVTFSISIGLLTLLPLINYQHWIFRATDFIKPQLLFANTVGLLLCVLILPSTNFYLVVEAFSMLCMAYCILILWPYTNVFKQKIRSKKQQNHQITLLSANVWQPNTSYQALIDIVKKHKPDILLTMESNMAWQNGLKPLESTFTYVHKIPLENTYGMHFYTNLKVLSFKENYLISNDLPSIETVLEDKNGQVFTFIGIHPPPPSPTEEVTSKERDGELLAVAKRVAKMEGAVIVAGDFNNVAWARSTKLFKRISGLENAHRGRGFVSTFHAKYPFFRCPIDQLFYSPNTEIFEFKTLGYFGSDHFPLYASFAFTNYTTETKEEATKEEVQEANELIKEGVLEARSNV